MAIIGPSVLLGVSRCPHCGVADPNLRFLCGSKNPIQGANSRYPQRFWSSYNCATCGGGVLVSFFPGAQTAAEMYPEPKEAHADIPEPARRYLQQAYETLHAPDAAAVMAGSAVDAMLKKLGLTEGSLYSRIDKAVENHIITKAMGDWAHEVRLGSNRPRHADKEDPHVTPAQAHQSVEFTEALGQFLFVLTARIERGTEDAKKAGGG